MARNLESSVCVIGVLVLLLAFAAVLGLHVALRAASSRLKWRIARVMSEGAAYAARQD